jgi:hypothetical protein
MKSTLFVSLLIIIMITSSISILYSQDSIWEDNGNYLLLQDSIPNIKQLKITKDSRFFYTFSDQDSVIIKRNLTTGLIVDSIFIDPEPSSLFFSSDSKYAIYSYGSGSSVDHHCICLMNLETRETVVSDTIKFYDLMIWNGYYYEDYSNFRFTLFDYFNKYGKLFLSFYIETGGGAHGELWWTKKGGIGIFTIEDNKLELVDNIEDHELLSYDKYDNKLFLTTFKYVHWELDGESHGDFYYTSYLYDVENLSHSYLFDKNLKAKWRDIMYNEIYDMVAARGYKTMHYLDLESREHTEIIYEEANNLKLTNSNRIIVEFDSSFIFRDFNTFNILDSIAAPINAATFLLIPENDNIMAYNKAGAVVKIISPFSMKKANFSSDTRKAFCGDTVKFYNLSNANISSYN